MTDAQRSHNRLEFLLAATPAVIYAFEARPPHRVTFVTAALEQQLGYTPDECTSDPDFWQSRIHAEDWPAVQHRLSTLRDQTATFDYRFRHKNGEYRWMHEQLRAVRDPDGSIVEILGSVVDATECLGLIEELRESRSRYEALFENANDIIFTTDATLRFTSLNAAGETLTGFTRDEVLQMRVTDVLAPPDHARLGAVIAQLLEHRAAERVEMDTLTKTGGRLTVEASVRPLFWDGRHSGFHVVARDVGERKRLEAQVRQAQKMEAVGRLAGGIAHDFNNVLTVIMGFGEMLQEALPAGGDPAASVAEILRAGSRAADLTRQLLAFSRRQILEPRVIDVNDLLGGMDRMIRRLIGEDIEVRLSLASDCGRIMADPSQIEQIVMNLVINARDAMPRGGHLTIETSRAILSDAFAETHPGARPGVYAVLAVSDDGLGMDAATQARIFEPFFTTKDEGKGTGLGLSTVYGIVKQSQGYIWVYSEPGVGSTFKVYLPDCADRATAIESEPRLVFNEPSGHEHILLVEDDEGVREFVAQALRASGYRLSVARSPAEANEMARGLQSIDLLLTDVVMPGAGGRFMADALVALHPRMRVLFMSGYTSEAIVNHGVLDAGVNFLAKPFSAVQLRARVREVLGRG